MKKAINMVHREHPKDEAPVDVSRFGYAHAKIVRDYHKSFPEYKETPLADLKNLAKSLGVASIHVKDESYRFGQNAFKVLGGSYCVASYIAEKLGILVSELSYEKINSPEIKEKLGQITFVTATDGNHGRGIAWTANRLGHKSVVYMPAGSSLERLNNIKACGAYAMITDLNYDAAVRYASEMAEKNGWVLVQDTAWEGYETIPGWIMEGYTTMACEALEQLNHVKPTHVFLQAGVGAMSGAVAGFFADIFKGKEKPVITIVEPDKADCIYRTAKANDGKLHIVKGDMHTIMAGLACGEPCTIGWQVLERYGDNFVSMSDNIAAQGMRILAAPFGDDPKVVSGESGAATFGFVTEILRNPEFEAIKKQIGLDKNSRIFCISTEGDTDHENYERIIWEGLYPSFE